MSRGSGGIYKIINKTTSDIYIGSTTNFNSRWIKHRKALNKGKHHSIILQNAWNKYGENDFEFHIIEKIRDIRSRLTEREQYYLDTLNPKYNICRTAGCPYSTNYWKGKKRSEETKVKISITLSGQKLSSERKHKMSLARKGKKGKPHTEKTKLRLSAAQKGKKLSKETKQKQSIAGKKRWAKWREERGINIVVRDSYAVAAKKRWENQEYRDKMLASLKVGKMLWWAERKRIQECQKSLS